jgi:hypothetical protein
MITAACHAREGVKAERCVFVELQGRQGLELVPLLDSFANTHELAANKSHPINPVYLRKSSEGEIEAQVSYLMGVGPFGAQLSLFRYSYTQNAELIAEFDDYVEHTIAANHKVAPCKPEQFPTIYR